jgi:hypothetical protein
MRITWQALVDSTGHLTVHAFRGQPIPCSYSTSTKYGPAEPVASLGLGACVLPEVRDVEPWPRQMSPSSHQMSPSVHAVHCTINQA